MEHYASLRPRPPAGFNPYLAPAAAETVVEESLLNMTLHHSFGRDASRGSYPERPGEPDCGHYMRTGTCAYGTNCRYNHPSVDKSQVATPAPDKEFPERPGLPECQYYMKTGTCKFGIMCKFHHPQHKAGSNSGQAQLNFLGLPIRLGEKDCPYYLRTGSCKFGAICKYHHPQPTAVGTVSRPASPLYSSTAPASPVHAAYQAGPPSRPNTSAPYMVQGPSTYMPGFVPPQSTSMPGWNVYQGSVSQLPSPHVQQQGMGRAIVYSAAQQQVDANAGGMPGPDRAPVGSTSSTVQSSVVQGGSKLPERPGQRDCSHFLKTGECKFGANCRYHHPKDRAISSVPLSFNPLGLPLRPGQPPCPFYIKHGICKFGPTCKFDHPVGPQPNTSISAPDGVPEVPYLSGGSTSTISQESVERLSETLKVEELIPSTQDKPNVQFVANVESMQIPPGERVAESTA